MTGLAPIGALIEVTPWDWLSFADEKSYYTIDDRTPFTFRVQSHLFDDESGKFFGLFGPITAGPKRYLNLHCNLMVRNIPNGNWELLTETQANFKVGKTKVQRNLSLDEIELADQMQYFHHPDGTKIDGFPRISTYATVSLTEAAG